MNKVYVIGIGPGTEEYLLPVARKEIENSDCLIGGKRALRLFQHLHKEEVPLEGNFEKVIPFLLKVKVFSFLLNCKIIGQLIGIFFCVPIGYALGFTQPY